MIFQKQNLILVSFLILLMENRWKWVIHTWNKRVFTYKYSEGKWDYNETS